MRLLFVLIAVLCALPALATPPARNLLVEVRIVDDSASIGTAARAGGSVTVNSSGRIDGAAAGSVSTRTRNQTSDAVQAVRVLNGSRASVRLASAQLQPDTEVAWTPWGAAAAVRSQWVELVNGFEVQPRWPGGDAPVLADIGVTRSTPGADRSAAVWSVLSTVQAPLGEWVDVAQLSGRSATTTSGGWNVATSQRQRTLQLRISAPP
jgi:hypothetical protein